MHVYLCHSVLFFNQYIKYYHVDHEFVPETQQIDWPAMIDNNKEIELSLIKITKEITGLINPFKSDTLYSYLDVILNYMNRYLESIIQRYF